METMTMETIASDLIVTVLQIVITGAVVPAIIYFVKWIRGKMNEVLGEEMAALIESAVWAAQQTITGNEEKKEYVRNKVYEWIMSKGLTISQDDVDMLIESTVLAMKTELNKI